MEIMSIGQIYKEIFVLISSFLGLFLLYYSGLKKLQNVGEQEFKESIIEGAHEEPHPLRDLTNDETSILEQKSEKLGSFVENPFKIGLLAVFLFVIISLGFLSITGDFVLFTQLAFLPKIIVIFLPSALISLSIVVYQFRAEKDFYHDLRLPVWQVQGAYIPLMAHKDRVGNYQYVYFSVRGEKFELRSLNKMDTESYLNYHLLQKLETLYEGVEVKVEYSPFSRFVWKIEQTIDV